MRKTSFTSNIILKICAIVMTIVVIILFIRLLVINSAALESKTIDTISTSVVSQSSISSYLNEYVIDDILNLPDNITAVQIPDTVNDLEYVETDDLTVLNQLIEECRLRKVNAHQMAEAARALGYSEDNIVIVWAKAEHAQARSLIKQYEQRYKELVEQEKRETYPTAYYIWDYLHELGYNDYVCAGIIGNFMTEAGGQSLNIIWNIHGQGYYGIAQWSNYYYPKINNASLEEQCNFLRDTIETTFNIYGFVYQSDFNYFSFLELTNEKDAALAFAKCYERCASGSYSVRQTNATKALEYFVN